MSLITILVNGISFSVTGKSATKEWHQGVIEGLRDEMVSKL